MAMADRSPEWVFAGPFLAPLTADCQTKAAFAPIGRRHLEARVRLPQPFESRGSVGVIAGSELRAGEPQGRNSRRTGRGSADRRGIDDSPEREAKLS
jgi:hypothetical protein